MKFLISDTFTDSLARLNNEEQKNVKLTVFDMQVNPEKPGLRFHKLERAKDKNFWSVSVSSDIRLIVHRTKDSLLICYVDHHDKAYDWAKHRKLEAHPITGAAQIVEIRERVEEIVVPVVVPGDVAVPVPEKRLPFASMSGNDLLVYGVPPEWIEDVRCADADSLLTLCDHLPQEAMEALIDIACGNNPATPRLLVPGTTPLYFDHPDAMRRFRIIENREELERAMDLPWEKWIVFLHPDQKDLVSRDYSGPARVSGSAGTGKTVVALHRSVWLARVNPDARVLLTTFSDPLAKSLETKLRQLLLQGRGAALAERIDVRSLDSTATRLYSLNIGKPRFASKEKIRELLESASKNIENNPYSHAFLFSEWEQIVDSWQIRTWEEYRNVVRLGRKVRLPEKQREVLWSIFEQVHTSLQSQNLLTVSSMYMKLADFYATKKSPYEHIVVDEAQDVSITQLRFLASLAAATCGSNALFFAGDLGQRIFQMPFSWKSLGVDIRGRAKTLRINYRTSHQIRSYADKLLDKEIADADGNVERRDNAISVFNGPEPEIFLADDLDGEALYVAAWLKALTDNGVEPYEIGIFVRSKKEIHRVLTAVQIDGMPNTILDERTECETGHMAIGTMHLAKGMEFKAVAVMACDEDILPLASRIAEIGEESDVDVVYNTERQLFYVACTRARENLLITCVKPGSLFIDDLLEKF